MQTTSGKTHPADVVILAIGVRPDTTLAKGAGLEVGERGGIRVDEQMRTSDPDIFAVGDAIEVKDWVTGEWSLVALAGPANRQGRIAADVIAGRKSRYRGTQGTAICGVFEGESARPVSARRSWSARRDGLREAYIYQNSHAGYYPGAKMMAIKVLFRKKDGRLLGAQLLAEDGGAANGSTPSRGDPDGGHVYDLEEAELCYAPPFGSAKDPVNFAGMVAADLLRGDMPLVHWDGTGRAFLLDVRTPSSSRSSAVPGAVNIPLHLLRTRLGDLPPRQGDPRHLPLRERAYYATRILLQNGFRARNLSGGMLARAMVSPA